MAARTGEPGDLKQSFWDINDAVAMESVTLWQPYLSACS
jgi:hypothetical protein